MTDHKILFTGPSGAGKTTALAAISETVPVVTDVVEAAAPGENSPTIVGVDLGQITLDGGDRIRLFGTPGQFRFDAGWRALARDALGMVILIDNSSHDPMADLKIYLDGFAQELEYTPCAIGIGRAGGYAGPSIDAYIETLERRARLVPVLEVDVRQRRDVLLIVDTLLAQVDARRLAALGLERAHKPFSAPGVGGLLSHRTR